MSAAAGAVPVLLAAGPASWESAAIDRLARRHTGLALHKRCVDLADLVASAATGLARAALVDAHLPGLDADAVSVLARAGVGVVVVGVPPTEDDHRRDRLLRLGARDVVAPDLAGVDEALLRAAAAGAETAAPRPAEPGDALTEPGSDGARVVAVWGPAGAPGRTTTAVGVSAELAHRGRSALLVDADPYGGAVAQHLGVLDAASGLLAAVRAANAGELDATRLAGLARGVGTGGSPLRVLTGLPRPDRWIEVRAAAYDGMLDAATVLAEWLVLDLGFSLESDHDDPFATGPQRNLMTTAALARADEVLVVGAADPVGLSRLARGLVDLHDLQPDAAVRVVVNRTRPSLGWSESEIHRMVEGFVRPVGVHFLPDDRAGADRALVSGRSLVEVGDSALRRALATVVDEMVGGRQGAEQRGGRRVRRRTAGRGR
jgi:MinD-like ATPase involved in chromosome partitioning or flagellar assembly